MARPRSPHRSSLPFGLLAAALSLVLAGCGTRLTDNEAQDQLAAAYAGSAGASGVAEGSAGTGAVYGSATTGAATSGGAVGSSDSTTGVESEAATTSGGSRDPATGAAGGSDDAASGGTRGERAPAGAKRPLVLGMVGTWSGVTGAAVAPARDAYQAWALHVNARGGINGHPVRVLNTDDKSSAATTIAAVKNYVEQQHAIAVVNLWPASGSLGPIGEYTQSKNIAVIGGNGYDLEWNRYPTLFPVTTGPDSQNYAWAAAMKDFGVKRVGAIFCSELPVCDAKKNEWKRYATGLGLEVVYEGGASLAAPNFTRECVEAQSAGAEALVPIMDGASANRIGRDCSRQRYNPKYVVPQPFNTAPASLDGAIAPITAFPWFLTAGSPAIAEYAGAIRKYVRNVTNSYTSAGWVNALLAERALEIATSKTSNPTGRDVLEALWSLRGETLGGLAPQPVRFNKNKPQPDMRCSFKVVATKEGERWTAPIGARPTYCRPG